MVKTENTIILIGAAIIVAFLFVAGFFYFADKPQSLESIARTYGPFGLFVATPTLIEPCFLSTSNVS